MTRLLNGRYELGDVVGSGGMGAVHRAVDVRLGRTVAVKVLRGGGLADELSRSRMRSEARLAGSVHHPGVAQVYDYAETSASHEGVSFIVMEYIDGQSLAQVLRAGGALPADQVVTIVHQVSGALAAAHAAGVVHRDLKPANIMLTAAGRIVLVDFGIARSTSSEPLTDTGALVGTVDYLSPEQAAGQSATPRSDLYALGVVAHHCLTGVSPFRRENQFATALAHLNDPLPDLDPTVPAGVRELVSRLTAKDPHDRPSSASDVAREAAALGTGAAVENRPTVGLTSIPLSPDLFPATTSTTSTGPRRAPGTARRPRRTLVSMSAGGIAVALVALLGLGQLRSSPPPPVPDVVGMAASDAAAAIEADGMRAKRTGVADVVGVPAGQVVSQKPAAGTGAPPNRVVDLTVASGKVMLSSDSVIGQSYAKAAAALEALGLVVARQDVVRSSDIGEVVALDQSGHVPDGATITLSVGVAPAAPAGSTTAVGSTAPAPAPAPAAAAPRRVTSGDTKSSGKVTSKGNGKAKSKAKSEKK